MQKATAANAKKRPSVISKSDKVPEQNESFDLGMRAQKAIQVTPVAMRICAKVRQSTSDSGSVSVSKSNRTVSIVDGAEKAGSGKQFQLDQVFDSMDAVDEAVLPLLDKAVEGYNVAMFLYGQTGSGKRITANEVMNYVAQHLFRKSSPSAVNSQVTFGCVACVNETLADLLVRAGEKQKDIKVKQDTGSLVGLTDVAIKSAAQLMDNYSTATDCLTSMNSANGIFIVTLTQENMELRYNQSIRKVSKIYIVELAASENIDVADVAAAKDPANSSKYAFVNVVSAFSKTPIDPPYEKSKLTQILRETLGGNCISLMFACLNPADPEQCLATLKFMQRAKKVRNLPRINIDPMVQLILSLCKTLEKKKEKFTALCKCGDSKIVETIAVAPPPVAKTDKKKPDTDSTHVRVCVRVRPSNSNEAAKQDVVKCIEAVKESNMIRIIPADKSEKKEFEFHAVFGSGDGQTEIYESMIRPLVDKCLEGYNGCIFAYGQTAAGKTFTVQGPTNPSPKDHGVIQRVCQHLFDHIEQQKQKNFKIEYDVKISYMEIYNETIIDLLADVSTKQDLQIRLSILAAVIFFWFR